MTCHGSVLSSPPRNTRPPAGERATSPTKGTSASKTSSGCPRTTTRLRPPEVPRPLLMDRIAAMANIQLAFSTNAFKKNTFEEALRAIAGIGYTAVELMADLHHAYPPLMTQERTAEIKRLLAELNLTVSNVNAFTLFACGDTYRPTWIEDSPEERKRRIDHTNNSIAMAADFGAKTISLQPGGPMIGTTMTRAEAGRRFAEGLEECVPLAKQKGVILAIEPEPGLFIQTAAEWLEFKNEFFRNEDAVKMNC